MKDPRDPKKYPSKLLLDELASLGIPKEKQDIESLQILMSKSLSGSAFVNAIKSVDAKPDEIAEVVIYLLSKKIIDLND